MQAMRLKRSLAAVLAATLLFAAGCGGAKTETKEQSPTGAQTAEQPITLEFWGGWTGPDGDVMRGIVEQWNKEHPSVKVNLTTLQWSPLFEKLITQAKAGSPPDILALQVTAIAQWAELGVLGPMDEMVAKAGFQKADFAQAAWNNAVYKDKLYGLPLDQHMHGLYYNVEMFEKAGLDPQKPPRTGQELIDAAIKLTVDANGKHPNEPGFDEKNVKQWGLGLPTNHHGFYMWFALMNQQGEGFLNKDNTKTQFDDAMGIKAWEWLGNLVHKYKVVPPGQTNATNDFKAGKTAMVVDGPWQLPGMESQQGLKWATAPFPKVFDKPAAWGNGHVLTVPVQKDQKRREAAMQVVAWIVKNSDLWAKSGQIPALNSAAEKAKNMPGRAAFMQQLGTTVMVPNITKGAQVFSSAATSPIVVASQAVLVANKPVPDTLKAMRQGIDQILSAP